MTAKTKLLVSGMPKIYLPLILSNVTFKMLTREVVYVSTKLTAMLRWYYKDELESWFVSCCQSGSIVTRYLSESCQRVEL